MRYETRQDPSLGDLFSTLTEETSLLVRQEVALAKTEMTEKAKALGKDVAFMVAGGVVAYAGLLTLIAAIAVILAQFMATWLAVLLTAVLVLAVGGGLIYAGINHLKEMTPVPEQTVASLKEDKRWLEQQVT